MGSLCHRDFKPSNVEGELSRRAFRHREVSYRTRLNLVRSLPINVSSSTSKVLKTTTDKYSRSSIHPTLYCKNTPQSLDIFLLDSRTRVPPGTVPSLFPVSSYQTYQRSTTITVTPTTPRLSPSLSEPSSCHSRSGIKGKMITPIFSTLIPST